MKKTIHFLLQCFAFLPCFSQTIGSEISFATQTGKRYSGMITQVVNDSFTVHFQMPGLSLSFATEQFNGTTQKTGKKAEKETNELGDAVEDRLRQEAAHFIGLTFQQCSYPESRINQCCFRFSELQDCNLYLFYTAKGYDFISTDYHIIKIDLSATFSTNPFRSVRSAEEVKGNDNYPVVEIAKHTDVSTYDIEQFRSGADWTNQPQYMRELLLCFLDETQPAYRNAREQLALTFDFLRESCRKKKR